MSCGSIFQGHSVGKQTAEGVKRKEAEEGVEEEEPQGLTGALKVSSGAV